MKTCIRILNVIGRVVFSSVILLGMLCGMLIIGVLGMLF